MLVPFVLTFVGAGLGFAHCSQSLSEGYPVSSPTWQPGWEEEGNRERKWRKVGTYVGGMGCGGRRSSVK